jgi:hypothetical protein
MHSFALMQPTFLPWIGYLKLIDLADTFIFYDNAKFSRQSFHQRNRIIINNEVKWLTMPCLNRFQQLNKTQYDKKAVLKLISKIRNSYSTNKEGNIVLDNFEEFYINSNSLAEANSKFILYLIEYLGISCNVKYASSFGTKKNPIEQIKSIGKDIEATQYISPLGSLIYMSDDEIKDLNNFFMDNICFLDLANIIKKSEFFIEDQPLSIMHYIMKFGKEKCRYEFDKIKI